MVALAVGLVGFASAEGRAQSSQRHRNWATDAVQKAMPSVVSISSEKKAASTSRWPFSAEENSRPRVSGMGTGVIVDPRGYILTNQHVVDKVQGIEVAWKDGANQVTWPARLIQQDNKLDIAVLKVEAGRPLPAITIGTSSDLMVGEDVITIGNAFGYDGTVGNGIIGALGRDVVLADDQGYHNLIQTNAPINPGNSGGPLINRDGELIGINVATRAGAQGIGFALPIDDVKRVATELMSTRRLAGTWHGLSAVETALPNSAQRGVILTDIPSGSPAEVAGAQVGDRVVRIDHLPITNTLDIERALLDARAGQRQELIVSRNGQELPLSMEVQAVPRGGAEMGDQLWKTLGLKMTPVQSEYVSAVSNKLRGGLYVHAVSANSPAARAQIQKGDILVGMSVGNRDWETIHPNNVLYVVKQSEQSRNSTIRFYVVRRNALQQGELPMSTAGPVANAATR
ncbi:MAG: trypsin-like peptidase domain-containing protein [Isosphaeraceae bacterium]